jgi:hypothetical protein
MAAFTTGLARRRAFPGTLEAAVAARMQTQWKLWEQAERRRRPTVSELSWGPNIMVDPTPAADSSALQAGVTRTETDELCEATTRDLAPILIMSDLHGNARYCHHLLVKLLRVSLVDVHAVPMRVRSNAGGLLAGLALAKQTASRAFGVAFYSHQILSAVVILKETDGGAQREYLCVRDVVAGAEGELASREMDTHIIAAPKITTVYEMILVAVARAIIGLAYCDEAVNDPAAFDQSYAKLEPRVVLFVRSLLCEVECANPEGGISIPPFNGMADCDMCDEICALVEAWSPEFTTAAAEACKEREALEDGHVAGSDLFALVSSVALRVVWPLTISRYCEQSTLNVLL